MARIDITSAFLGLHPQDGVTRQYFPVAKLNGSWPRHRASELFDQVEHNLLPGPEVTFDVRELYTVLDRLKAWDIPIEDQPPFTLWEKVTHYIDESQVVEESQLAQRIGVDFWAQLHPFQRVGVQQMVRMERCFNMDEMGTGKTIQSIAYCAYFREHWPVGILCPSSLRYTWQKELQHWLPGVKVLVPKTSAQLKRFVTREEPFDFLVLSYGLLKTLHELDFRPQILVCDESHYLKSTQSKRSDLAARVASKAKYRLLLSGSPFSYSHELYAQLRIVDEKLFPHFFNFRPFPDQLRTYFVHRYCQPVQKQFGPTRTQWEYKGFERSPELHALLNCLAVRRRKQDVLSQLPAKHRTCIYLPPLSEKDQKELKDLLDPPAQKAVRPPKKRKNGKDVPALSSSSPYAYMEAFRFVAQCKLDAVIEFVKEFLALHVGEKLILFFHHRIMGEALQALLTQSQVSHFLIDGRTNPTQRQAYVDAFQTEDLTYQVAVLSLTAASAGLTLTQASIVVFTEILFGPDLHLQAEDRAHRLGQRQQVNIFYLLLPKSTDDINFGLIRKKNRESLAIMDGKEQAQEMVAKRKGYGDLLEQQTPLEVENVVTKRTRLLDSDS